KWKYGWDFEEASPLNQVKKCRLPMLVIHGTNDDFVPTAMAQPIYDAKPQPKALYMAQGSAHARSLSDHRQEYTAKVRQFTEKYIK
ncbi:MAG: alpha/beta hydrolase, partial [Sodaliphilus sp.]|nr:alpha/beta hydrolase [Sodaliphilus sp.]